MRKYDLYLLGVVGLVELVRRTPFLRLEKLLIPLLSTIAYHTSTLKREQVERNLAYSYKPAKDDAVRRVLTYQVFEAFWQEMFEWAHADSYFSARATVQGLEYLEEALARGKGVILWESTSYGKRIAAQAILHTRGYDMIPVHAFRHLGGIGPGDDRDSYVLLQVIRRYFDTRERERVADIIYLARDTSLTFTRELVRHLSRNEILCVAFDGVMGQKYVTLDFMGQPRPFATGMLSLARLSGATLLPMYCTPTDDGGYFLEIMAPQDVQGVEAHNRVPTPILRNARELEARIRAHPDWYRHWHLLDNWKGRAEEQVVGLIDAAT